MTLQERRIEWRVQTTNLDTDSSAFVLTVTHYAEFTVGNCRQLRVTSRMVYAHAEEVVIDWAKTLYQIGLPTVEANDITKVVVSQTGRVVRTLERPVLTLV